MTSPEERITEDQVPSWSRAELAAKVKKASHDLRNALLVLFGIGDQLLQSAPPGSPLAETAQSCAEVNDRLHRLALELREVGLAAAGAAAIDPGSTAEGLAAFWPEASRVAAALKGAPRFSGDPTAFERLLALITLAVCTRSESRIQAATVRFGSSLRTRIEIRIDGPGIHPALRTRLEEVMRDLDGEIAIDARGTRVDLLLPRIPT